MRAHLGERANASRAYVMERCLGALALDGVDQRGLQLCHGERFIVEFRQDPLRAEARLSSNADLLRAESRLPGVTSSRDSAGPASPVPEAGRCCTLP